MNRSRIRFLAPLTAAVVFAIAFLAVYFSLDAREKANAVAELNALLDTANTRVAAETEALSAFDGEADAAAIHKARTVARLLAHDDSLLETDALAVLCELVGAESISVADGEGGVVAASNPALLGTGYAGDTAMAWAMALLDEEAAPAAGAYGETGRIGGAPRTDIEGFVLVWDKNALLTAIAGAADIRGAVENLAVAPDAIQLVETTGEDGVFEQDGKLYVQRAVQDVTLIASRPLARVHAVENALLVALAAFAALSIALLFIWQLLPGKEPAEAAEAPEEGPEPELFSDEEARRREPERDAEMQIELQEELERSKKHRRKRRHPLIELVEVIDEDETELAPEEPEPAPEPAPETPKPPRRKGPRSVKRTDRQPPEGGDDDGFDQIFE